MTITKYIILIFILFLLLITSTVYADYSNVLLVANSNSATSQQIATYFSQNRVGMTNIMNVTLPAAETTTFGVINASLLQPVKAWLQANGSGINYIVLTKDIPLYTSGDVLDYFGAGNSVANANASSVDSELALINGPYESSIGQKGIASNPYYGSTVHFNHSTYGIYLVTRLDAYNYTDVKNMIDRGGLVNKTDRNSGLHVLMQYNGIASTSFAAANASLSAAGLTVLYNSSASAQYPANLQNVSYFDTFGCYNFGGCNASYLGNTNYTWKNGSFVSIKYSYSGSTTTYVLHNVSYIADYVHEGAAGGFGYAVEPFSFYVADPQILANAYLAGRNFAEMAWSSENALSWAGVIFGDPKTGYPTADTYLSPAQLLNVTTNLTCTVYVSDGFHATLNLTYEWFLNNTVNQSGSMQNAATDTLLNISTISVNLTGGDRWLCRVNGSYGGTPFFSVNSSAETVGFVAYPYQILNTTGATYLMNASASIVTNGFNITAPNITLDCSGYALVGNNTGYGVYSNQNGTVIRNCNLYNFSTSINYVGAVNGLIQNVSINANASSDNGINLGSTLNITVKDTTVTAAGANGAILVTNGVNNTLAGINAYSKITRGVYVSTSNYTLITNSNASCDSSDAISILGYNNSIVNSIGVATGGGNGIYFTSGSGNAVINSTGWGKSNGGSGIYFNTGESYDKIINSLGNGTGTGSGIYARSQNSTFINVTGIATTNPAILFGAGNNTIVNSTGIATSGAGLDTGTAVSSIFISNFNGTSNTGYGITLDTQGKNITIVGSFGTSNTSYGIYVQGSSSNNTIANSTFTSNSGNGIYMNGNYATFSNVTAISTTGDAAYFFLTFNNTFYNLTATSLSGSGIKFDLASYNNTFYNTTATSVQGPGILISTGSSFKTYGNTFINAVVTSNSSYALLLKDSGSVFRNATFISNSTYALNLSASANNTFLGNTIIGPGWVSSSDVNDNFNDSTTGNAYYFLDGRGAWANFDMVDADGNGWADAGAAVPFNSTNLGNPLWNGTGADYHPYIGKKSFGNETSIIAVGLQNITVAVGNYTNLTGRSFDGDNIINILSLNRSVVTFDYNFSVASMNFSTVNITNGTQGTAAYTIVKGINSSALVTGKNVTIYDVSAGYNAVCVKSQENIDINSISSTCTGVNETIVLCDGAAHNGITCTQAGTNLTISNLSYSGIVQFQYTAPAGNTNTPSGGGGGSLPLVNTSNTTNVTNTTVVTTTNETGEISNQTNNATTQTNSSENTTDAGTTYQPPASPGRTGWAGSDIIIIIAVVAAIVIFLAYEYRNENKLYRSFFVKRR